MILSYLCVLDLNGSFQWLIVWKKCVLMTHYVPGHKSKLDTESIFQQFNK